MSAEYIEGPLGLHMTDTQATELEPLLKADSEHLVFTEGSAISETQDEPEDRFDVSWISTEMVDKDGDIVLASGMDESIFKKNPIVTLNHDYKKAPVGKSLWRKKASRGKIKGIKAKTLFPSRPDNWHRDEEWMPDVCFDLIKAELMRGKSIGLITLESRQPNRSEAKEHKSLFGKEAKRVITKWLLMEYCCTWMPVQPQALVEEVSGKCEVPLLKSFCSLAGVDMPEKKSEPEPEPEPEPEIIPVEPPKITSFVSIDTVKKVLERKLSEVDMEAVGAKLTEKTLDRIKGKL